MTALTPVVLVEGRYDRDRILQLFDATVLTTEGFGIFNNEEKLCLLRRMAETRGLLVFTDPDGAGFVIRNYIKGAVQGGKIYHAYIPDIPGKERRKRVPSKEGKLGVEGVSNEMIVAAVERSGALDAEPKPRAGITKTDLYELGLTGGSDSVHRRREIQQALSLPERMSANALLDVLNCVTDLQELSALVSQLERENEI
jgi:Small primase-like proteins (Toprim domain)